jgi:hypothetical protein
MAVLLLAVPLILGVGAATKTGSGPRAVTAGEEHGAAGESGAVSYVGAADDGAALNRGPEPHAQFGGGNRSRGWSPYEEYGIPQRDIFPSSKFTFARVQYGEGYGGGRRGRGGRWDTDYPESDINFPIRLSEVTTIEVNKKENGEVKPDIVRLDEPELFNYPFIYMLEVGGLQFTPEEREHLRNYLLRGGFLLVDDFWGYSAWQNMKYELGLVLPPDEYPIVDIPLSHELFHIVFEIKEVPQVPSEGHYDTWLRTGITYERGHDYMDPRAHCRGIFDKKGRLMVVLMHNTDLGDGWEREGENYGYFRDFSIKKAYPMGINIVVYAMTH